MSKYTQSPPTQPGCYFYKWNKNSKLEPEIKKVYVGYLKKLRVQGTGYSYVDSGGYSFGSADKIIEDVKGYWWSERIKFPEE